jgi:hypothetical protein
MGKQSDRFIEAPIKGLNLAMNLMAPEPGYAIRLQNLICDPSGLLPLSRFTVSGSLPGAAGTPGTLIPHPNTGANQIVVACSGGFYTLTEGGVWAAAGGAALVGSQDGNTVAQSTGAGTFSFFFNGTGAGFSITPAGVIAASGITGPANILAGSVYRKRLYLIEVASAFSTGFWYLAADAITGAATFYSISSLLSRGGYVTAVASFSKDGGNGPDDYLVVYTTTGEVVVFYGNDPGAADWRVVGVFQTAPPASYIDAYAKVATKVGGDVWLVTKTGIISVASLLVGKEVSPSDPINPLLRYVFSVPGSYVRAKLFHLATQQLVLLYIQGVGFYCMSTQTGGWSTLDCTAFSANPPADLCEVVFSSSYWGYRYLAATGVYKAFQFREGCEGGSLASWDVATPFLRFGNIANHKLIQVRPFAYSNTTYGYRLGAAQSLQAAYNIQSVNSSTAWSASGVYHNVWPSGISTNTSFVSNAWSTIAGNGGFGTSLYWGRLSPTAGEFSRFLGWDLREEGSGIGGP